MVKKFPLLRGKGINKPVKASAIIVKISDLNVFKDGEVVDAKNLGAKKIIKEEYIDQRIKILANGKLEKKLIVKLPVSLNVKKMIEGIGGRVE